MRAKLERYIRENWDALLAFDLSLARLLGAPAPHTLSGWAYKREQDGSRCGKFWRRVIDFLAWWVFDEKHHCKTTYLKEAA